ncbi:MAG: tetratricopeptide repeat protein [Myxococcota bacterium]
MVRASARRSARSRARGVVSIWIASAVAWSLSATPAYAQGDNADELARRHFESGAAYLEESDYDNALRAFQKAYDLSKRPEILINIATVQERRADIDGAITALKAYLEAAPNGEHAETVRLRIQNLEKRRPATPSGETPPAASSVPAPEPARPAPVLAPQPPPPTPIEPQRPNRVPAFIALGVGAAAGAGALVTGLIAKGKYDDLKDTCSPNCTDAQLSSSRSLALTSTLLTGVAIVGAGVGVTLLIVSKPSATQSAQHIEVSAHPTFGGAAARASWRF